MQFNCLVVVAVVENDDRRMIAMLAFSRVRTLLPSQNRYLLLFGLSFLEMTSARRQDRALIFQEFRMSDLTGSLTKPYPRTDLEGPRYVEYIRNSTFRISSTRRNVWHR